MLGQTSSSSQPQQQQQQQRRKQGQRSPAELAAFCIEVAAWRRLHEEEEKEDERAVGDRKRRRVEAAGSTSLEPPRPVYTEVCLRLYQHKHIHTQNTYRYTYTCLYTSMPDSRRLSLLQISHIGPVGDGRRSRHLPSPEGPAKAAARHHRRHHIRPRRPRPVPCRRPPPPPNQQQRQCHRRHHIAERALPPLPTRAAPGAHLPLPLAPPHGPTGGRRRPGRLLGGRGADGWERTAARLCGRAPAGRDGRRQR